MVAWGDESAKSNFTCKTLIKALSKHILIGQLT